MKKVFNNFPRCLLESLASSGNDSAERTQCVWNVIIATGLTQH